MDTYEDEARISRATSQRLFLIDREHTQDQVVFDVMGSTGNVYRISCDESNLWTCTCPDHIKRKQDCKHIYFIKIKVLKELHSWEDLSRSNPSELQVDACVLIEEGLKKTYEEKKRGIDSADLDPKEKPVLVVQERKEWIDQECMVCCEPMVKTDENELFTCPQCKSSIHGICWSMWSRTKETCVYCRYICPIPKEKKKKSYGKHSKRRKQEDETGYINLLS